MSERLILNYPDRELLIKQIESQMKPGEIVMAEEGRELHIAQMVHNRVEPVEGGKKYLIAPGPTYIVVSDYGSQGVCWIKKPVALEDYEGYFNKVPRIYIKKTIAVGNEAVSEYFAEYCDYHLGSRESELINQRNYLIIAHHLGMTQGGYLRKIQEIVAGQLVRNLIKNVPSEVRTSLITGRNIAGNDIVFVPESHDGSSPEDLKRFLATIEGAFALDRVLDSLNALVDTGLYGLGLEVEVPIEDSIISRINVDGYFLHLARYYRPRLTPREIPREFFDRD
jgi:hypothetical protein